MWTWIYRSRANQFTRPILSSVNSYFYPAFPLDNPLEHDRLHPVQNRDHHPSPPRNRSFRYSQQGSFKNSIREGLQTRPHGGPDPSGLNDVADHFFWVKEGRTLGKGLCRSNIGVLLFAGNVHNRGGTLFLYPMISRNLHYRPFHFILRQTRLFFFLPCQVIRELLIKIAQRTGKPRLPGTTRHTTEGDTECNQKIHYITSLGHGPLLPGDGPSPLFHAPGAEGSARTSFIAWSPATARSGSRRLPMTIESFEVT